jgi:hypothetical protein
LNGVRYRRRTVLVERGGKLSCQLTPTSDTLDFHLSDQVTLLDWHVLAAALARRGVTVGTHDLMIGATALALTGP